LSVEHPGRGEKDDIMTSDFQRQSRRRKIGYALAILALFSLSLVYRPYLLEAQADSLALREQNQGEVDPLAAAVRLSLTGSRGVVLCFLWNLAVELQARREWNKLEVVVRAILQLQPHSVGPWLFQSWNVAYNFSAESDRIRDKYYFISRGIELLAEGERQNRDNPDFRHNIGNIYLSKIGTADQQRTLRTLFQLSCMDPLDRDPARMRTPDGKVDLARFRTFCERYPQVARRLREMLNLKTPEEVLDFLAEYSDIPSRYEKPQPGVPGPSRLKPADKQFPILPRPEDIRRDQAKYGHGYKYDYTADDVLPSSFDNYSAAILWFTYAQEPLPHPTGQPGPGSPAHFDRSLYRLPRQPMTILFRGFSSLAQTRRTEQVQREGWFDHGWEVDRGKQGPDRWFPDKLVVGEFSSSKDEWEKAYWMWKEHGQRNALDMDAKSLAALIEKGELYRKTFGVDLNTLDPRLKPEDFDGELRESFIAHYKSVWYQHNASLTRCGHFIAQAEAEKDPDAIAARALFFEAIRRRKAAAPVEEVRRLYEAGFAKWLPVLDRYPLFRRDLDVQELNFRLQYRYLATLTDNQDPKQQALRAVQEHLEKNQTNTKQLMLVPEIMAQLSASPAGPLLWLNMLAPGTLFERPKGPFEGKDYISPEAVRRGRTRLDLDELH
jgi:hypothetical protein